MTRLSEQENGTENELHDPGTYCTGVGCRVVRGPDWKWNKQDGGEGHVGSVRRFDTSGEAIVVWDSGIVANYRCGVLGFDLRVLDSAPTGSKHPGTICESCHESPIYGIRWKCVVCLSTDLCSTCYHADKHSLAHQFLRITAPYKTRVIVGRRLKQRRVESLGLFPKARVVRGIDWSWDSQDCVSPLTSSSSGSILLGPTGSAIACRSNLSSNNEKTSAGPILLPTQGRITGRRDWYQWAPRSAALVAWDSGAYNVYRVGYGGLVDLKAIRPSKGGMYYVDHLPLLADLRQYSDEPCVPDESNSEVSLATRHDLERGPVVPNWTNLHDLESRRRQTTRNVDDVCAYRGRISRNDGTLYSSSNSGQYPDTGYRTNSNVLSNEEPAASSCLNVCTLASRLHLQPSSIESSHSTNVTSRRSHSRLSRPQYGWSTDRETEEPGSPCAANVPISTTGRRSFGQTARTLLTDFLRTNSLNPSAPTSRGNSNSVNQNHSTNHIRSHNNDHLSTAVRDNRPTSIQCSTNDHRIIQNARELNISSASYNQCRNSQSRIAITNRGRVLTLHTRDGLHNSSSSNQDLICGYTTLPDEVIRENNSTGPQTIRIQRHTEAGPRSVHSAYNQLQTVFAENPLDISPQTPPTDDSEQPNIEIPNCSHAQAHSNSSEDLIQAANEGNVKRLKCLLQHHNVNVNGISSGLTALHAACQAGHLACVILLLQYGARRRNLDSSDNEAIHSAVQSGNIDILRILMRPHTDITSRLVNISEENDVVEGNLVDLDDNSPTNENNNRFDSQEILDINARNALRQTPLHLAVNRQNIPMVQCLLEEMNALTNLQDCDGDTPLHDAISSQNTTLVELLLRHNPDLTILNNAGQNSLHCATVHGGTEIIRLLLEHCSSTPWIVDETQPDGLTALHLASLNGNMEAVDLLLQAGASPNLVVRRPAGLSPLSGCDEEKLGSVFTPLHLAVHKAHPDVVCLLLCYRARAACRSGAGRSPMQLALNALGQVHESQGANVRRFDVALVPFLASVARLLVRMADSLTLTPTSTAMLSSGINKLRLNSNRNNYEEQLIEIDNDPDDEPHRNTTAESLNLVSPSALCRRLKSTIQATLETGVPRNVLIAACLASAIGAESWSSHLGTINSESAEEDNVDNVTTESISENFVTDVFRECRDPVLQLALQQCHMEALNFIKCYPLNTDSINRSPRHDINRSNSPLLSAICDSDEENLVDTFFQTDNRQIPPADLLPSCSVVGSNNSFVIQSPLINQANENSLNQPFAIENQFIPEPNNLRNNMSQSNVYALLPPTLGDIDLEWRECLVCSERNRSTVILPCGHIITCETCTPLIKKCLLCRQRIAGYHKFSLCCECNLSNGVVLARPCNHMLWCKPCLKTKVQQLEIIHQITGDISFFEEEEDVMDNRNQVSSTNNTTINNTDLLNISASLPSGTSTIPTANSATQSSMNSNIDELDPLFSTEPSSSSLSSVNRTNDINLWRNVPLGRLLSMINKMQSLLDDLLTGGICLDGCPICDNAVQSLCPVLIACSGVNNQSTTIALRHNSNPFTLNSSNSIETELNPTASNITSILPTNNSVLTNIQTDMELVQNQLVSSKPPRSLSPIDHQNFSGLVNTSTRQHIITPNNQLRQGGSRAEVIGRPRGLKTHLCERELDRLKHELQVMREQIRCPICLDRSRNLVFMCGHATCQWCGDQVTACPICRRAVESRIILY
ncbi:unnamed protein product [Schistosoma rodhaini]|uniref:RING-type E3 ubiquitin transferase n=1 Tax=Schistosoma rodhaini TaxID=6188 RepID=A0AA85ENB0_9TREM|nr:unnamed protein product [Schistosoma rodhaini]